MSKSLNGAAGEGGLCETCHGPHGPNEPCDTLIPLVAAAAAGTQLMGVSTTPAQPKEWRAPGAPPLPTPAPSLAPPIASPVPGHAQTPFAPAASSPKPVMPPSMDEDVDPLIGQPVG